MPTCGTHREVLWGSDLPGDAQTLLGPLAENPFEAVLALLVLLGIGVAFIAVAALVPVLEGSGRVPSQASMHSLAGPAPYAYSDRTLFSVERTVRGERQHTSRSGLNFNSIRPDSVPALTKRRSEQMLAARVRGAKSTASLARGPPAPRAVIRVDVADGGSRHSKASLRLWFGGWEG
jgi:hypothetical protein